MMNSIAIQTKNLEKKYGDKVAVDKINLSINEGELFSLLGVNGAGKTTTINMLSCLSKPTSGDALIFNKSILKDTYSIKELMSVSPQETAIAPNLTVRENIVFIANIYGINDINKINKIIEEFKFKNIEDEKANTLSGGWKRKLSIAMALITEPKILFLDEPTLGLDVLARRELWKLINDLKGKITIILTTHYMEEAEELSDRVAIMVNGKIIITDSPKNIIKKAKTKNFEEAFIKIVEGEK